MKEKKYEKLVIGIIGLVLVAAIFYGLSIWTDRNLEFAISYFKGTPVEIPMWLSFLATVILNAIALAFNVVCEILRIAL